MSPLDTLTLLGRLAPFDRLNGDERLSVASVLRERHYAADSVVQPKGEAWPHLLILVGGSWQAEGSPLPPLLGVASVLGADDSAVEVRAGVEGVHCLMLEKGHFFTMANECPNVLLGLLSLADGDNEMERGFK